MVSSLPPPKKPSLPSPPYSVSFPASPVSVSAPRPPMIVSLPAPPLMRSLPAPPSMTSSVVVPVITSFAAVPLIVAITPVPVMLDMSPRPAQHTAQTIKGRLAAGKKLPRPCLKSRPCDLRFGRIWICGLGLEAAYFLDRAAPTLGFAGFAQVAAMQDQPMMGVHREAGRNGCE